MTVNILIRLPSYLLIFLKRQLPVSGQNYLPLLTALTGLTSHDRNTSVDKKTAWRNKMAKKFYLALTISLLPVICWAAKKRGMPYDQWLLHFKAYDAYVRYLQTKNPTPESIISQARLLLTLNKPSSSLDILKQFETLPGFEGQRLWLIGKAYRMLGKYDQAISSFVAAARYFSIQPSFRIPSTFLGGVFFCRMLQYA